MEIIDDDLLNFPSASLAHYLHPENQCGKDNRAKIGDTTEFPWSAICAIYIEGRTTSGRASGFFISPQCIITAGHVVYPDRHWLNAITIVPGQNGSNAPFGKQRLVRDQSLMLSAPIEWLRDGNSNFDYGAILLPDTFLYDRVRAYFDYTKDASPRELNNSGYPADKSAGTQWFNGGSVERQDFYRFFYLIDTNAGQSGSPVWTLNGEARRAVGVHAYGGCPNSAIRCSSAVALHWRAWINGETGQPWPDP